MNYVLLGRVTCIAAKPEVISICLQRGIPLSPWRLRLRAFAC